MTREPLELLRRLVAIPSHATQPEGIAEVGAIVGDELAALGFVREESGPATLTAPEWAADLLGRGVPFDQLPEPAVWTRPGSGDGRLLLLGDLDTALPTPSDRCRLEVRDGRAIGPGVADMKGGLVVLIEALRRLAGDGRPCPPTTIVLSGDEQAGSVRSAATIRQHAEWATWALCLECARDGGRLMRSRGHIGVGRLVASGVDAHAGSARAAGVNAVVILARAIVALEDADLSHATATLTPTIVAGGTRRSVVPGHAEIVLDVRASDAASWDRLEARMREVLASLPDAERVQLDLYAHRPGLSFTERGRWLLDLVAELGRRQGLAIEAIDSLAAGSSAFVDADRVAALDGMGPAGGALMTPDEYVLVDSIDERATLLAATIAGLAAGERS